MEGKKFIKNVVMAALGGLGLVYLLNPGAGVFELFPDVIPGIGNLDEAAATALVITALAYFGIDITKIFGGKSPTPSKNQVVDIDAEVDERK